MSCTSPTCFLCTMKEQNIVIRRSRIKKHFKEMLSIDQQERVLILSTLWKISMNQPEDPEFPYLEQRVAVRALGHLASYDSTFEMLVVHEEEAEEWASQIQCWSLHLLNCFAIRGRSIDLICNQDFLKDLSSMWGGLMNHTSPSGIGLIRILCYTQTGRTKVSESKEVIECICNLSRSSDDWQYMGIDCLLLLLLDMNTRYKVLEIASFYLLDLIELRKLGERSNLGQKITKALLIDYKNGKSGINNPEIDRRLKEIWVTKVDKNRREKLMSDEKLEEKRVLVNLIKQQANHHFWSGDIESAVKKYTEGLKSCPLKLRKERIVLYSNRAQCYLLVNDPDSAISDTTRSLSISKPTNSHVKSLWRRSQAYYMKGLAKESLMDCLMFINAFVTEDKRKHAKIPYYAVHMIKKLMDLTWFFAPAKSKLSATNSSTDCNSSNEEFPKDEMPGLYTILEDPVIRKDKEATKRKDTRYENQKSSIVQGYINITNN
ncbi:hypothetical protein E3N88_10337 [Mikania micrantha]|uniref:ARM repeat N-terminal plant domain-containing protein n=1 Tax=Mikania micrantha TaxID=192012 RepID=A0A5N6PD67_9ASTR|nr:hypothetical protein E3N88_10337 [Mikania micrantha]